MLQDTIHLTLKLTFKIVKFPCSLLDSFNLPRPLQFVTSEILLGSRALALESEESGVDLDLDIVVDVESTGKLVVHLLVAPIQLSQAPVNTVFELFEVLHEIREVFGLTNDAIDFNLLLFELAQTCLHSCPVVVEIRREL